MIMRDGQGFSDTRKVNDLDSEASWLEWRARAAAYCRAFHGLSPEEREDIAGETVSRAWTARDRFDSARPFAPWFFTIVRRLALDSMAKNRGKEREDSSATLGILPSPLAMGILVFTLAIIAMAVLVSGGSLSIFIDLPSYAVIFLIPAAIAWASWPVRDMGRAFSAPFDPGASRTDLEKSRLFFELVRRWMFMAAGTMVGLVCILKYADGSNLDKIGRNLAVMLLCVTSAIFVSLAFTLPLESLARRRLAELG